MKRSAPIAAALAVVVLLLAGCSTIPMTGPVQRGPTEAADDSNIVFIPNPPVQGASKDQIVRGFLTAASEGGSFRVAREYLTPKAVSTWKPRTQVLVQRAQPTVTSTTATSMTLTVPLSAVIDQQGFYSPSARSLPLGFELVQRSGQWRIDRAPDGIVLGESVFQKVYTPLALQFFDSSWTQLVPDPRWFPISTSRDASSAPQPATVVRALIAGPSGPLREGVTSNALQGARLESVQSIGGDATTVSLTAPERNPTAKQTTRMQQQLAKSLGLAASALRLFVNGVAVGAAPPVVDQPTLISASYVLAGRRFGTLSSAGRFTDERTLGPSIVATAPTAATVSVRQKVAAVLTGSGQVAAVTPRGTKVLDGKRTSVVEPTLDQRAWVYSVPVDSPGEVIASTAGGTSVRLDLGLGGADVLAIEASPDGTRMLMLTGGSARGPRAVVAGIERNAEGVPTGFTTQRYQVALGGSDGTGVDATWVDDATVATLVRSPDATQQVWIQPLGKVGVQQGQVANATSLAGGSGLAGLRVLLQNGAIWTWATNTWQAESSTSIDVDVLAVQR